MELTKNSTNAEVLAAFKAAGVEVTTVGTILDIRPTKTVGKSTVFVIAEVNLHENVVRVRSINSMSAFELKAQSINTELLLRGKVTMLDTIIKENGLAIGTKLTMTDKASGEVLEAQLEVYEQFNKFYDTQKPIGFMKDGVFEAKLKQGKPYYRDTQVVADTPQHQIIPNETEVQVGALLSA